jgi:hypothetical protein
LLRRLLLGDERPAGVYRHLPAQGDAFLAIRESWSRRELFASGFDDRRIRPGHVAHSRRGA